MNVASRLNSAPPPRSCDECAFEPECGGLDGDDRKIGCFRNCSGCTSGPCDCACPLNVVLFDVSFEQVGGICTPPDRMGGPRIPPEYWPSYIPAIYHGSMRELPLAEPWVTVPLHHVTNLTRRGSIDLRYEDRAALCKALGLADNTRILLTSVCKDPHIEAFWASRRSRRLLERIAALGLVGMTTPNYSFMLDTPRTNSLWNLTRIFRMVEWITDAGIPVIPHINASTQADWKKWIAICKAFPDSRFYSMEFQTGLGRGHQGTNALGKYLDNLENLQMSCGGRIHPIVLGGIRAADRLAAICPSFSIVDSTPFMKTTKRQKLIPWGSGQDWRLVSTQNLEDLSQRLQDNINQQRDWFYNRFGFTSAGKLAQPPLYPAA